MRGIGRWLTDTERELLAEELPIGLALLLGGDGLALPLDHRVLPPGLTRGNARELLASVGRVLVEELSPEASAILRRVPELASVFAGDELPGPDPAFRLSSRA